MGITIDVLPNNPATGLPFENGGFFLNYIRQNFVTSPLRSSLPKNKKAKACLGLRPRYGLERNHKAASPRR